MKSNKAVSFGYRFGVLFRLNTFFLNSRMKQFGISAGQVSCLAELMNSKEPVSQNQLAESLVIDPAATARTIEILLQKGLVERIVNPQNRRQNLVSVTMTAKNKYAEYFRVLNEIDEVFKNDLTAEEHAVAVKLLDKMIAGAMEKNAEHK